METDLVLVERAARREPYAWEILVRCYSGRIYSACYRRTGKRDWAEDLTQETFLRVFRNLDKFNPQRGSFAAWLMQITYNLLIDHHRHTHPAELVPGTPKSVPEDPSDALEFLPSPMPSPFAQLEARELNERIWSAMARLSPLLREAIILRYLQGLDYREIGNLLKISHGTVKSRIHRGHQELTRWLAPWVEAMGRSPNSSLTFKNAFHE